MIVTNIPVWASFKTDEGIQTIPVLAWDDDGRALIAHETPRLVLAEDQEGFEKLTTDGVLTRGDGPRNSSRRPSHFG